MLIRLRSMRATDPADRVTTRRRSCPHSWVSRDWRLSFHRAVSKASELNPEWGRDTNELRPAGRSFSPPPANSLREINVIDGMGSKSLVDGSAKGRE
jgi:hypothetical protein